MNDLVHSIGVVCIKARHVPRNEHNGRMMIIGSDSSLDAALLRGRPHATDFYEHVSSPPFDKHHGGPAKDGRAVDVYLGRARIPGFLHGFGFDISTSSAQPRPLGEGWIAI
ncbi:hypothetical protein VTK73DRAFT_9461 [Phialemonium thermophilum]|uniref:Uncharacterized protein n=1 Tax=Phialemonium thermophilum TaxID=223376 RepID=A0ABR3W258_9PEZI